MTNFDGKKLLDNRVLFSISFKSIEISSEYKSYFPKNIGSFNHNWARISRSQY